MPKFYAYIRVSSPHQAAFGYSLDAQGARARAYFEYQRQVPGRENLVWGGVFRENGTSAFKKPLIHRKAGGKMHAQLQAGDHVVFIRLDRGFRNTRDFLTTYPMWESRGVVVHFLDLAIDMSTANGRLVATIIAAIAEWESAVKGERVRATLDNLALDGRHALRGRGTRRVGQRLVPHFEHLAIGRLIERWHERDKLTYYEVSDRLEKILSEREHRPYLRRCEDREWSMMRCHRIGKTRKEILGEGRVERRMVDGKLWMRVLGKDGTPVSDWYASRATVEREAMVWRAYGGRGYKCQPGRVFEEVTG
jgi:DNA invertase Pin-like site-specific DNA recombinase